VENLNEAIAILDLLTKVSVSISEDRTFTIRSDKIEEIKKILTSKNIRINELLAHDEIKLDSDFYNSYNILVFSNFDCFYRLFKLEDVQNKTLVILGNNNDELVVCKEQDGVFVAYTFFSGITNLRASNFFYLKKIIKYFIPKIADYEDSPNSTFVFLSPECGRLDIFIRDLPSLAENKDSFESIFNSIFESTVLKDYSEVPELKEQYIVLLKNRIISGLNRTLPEDRFAEFIKRMNQILEGTKRDFELFTSSFKHEEKLKQFENEKYLFADKIRLVLERISTNILSVPASIIVALFAIRDMTVLWLSVVIFIALGLFVLFTTVMNLLFYKDLSNLKEEMEFKCDFLTKGAETLEEEFRKHFKPFENRIDILQCLIKVTIIIFIVFYITFLFWYIKKSLVLNIGPILICLLTLS
jgi:hypothetical protein